MDPLFGKRSPGFLFADLRLQKIFHRLYIVIGLLLGLFYPKRILETELFGRRLQVAFGSRIQRKETLPAKEEKILHFHQYPITDECILRKIVIQEIGRAS